MDAPLVICDSYAKRDRVAKYLYLTEVGDIPVEMDQNHVTEYGGGGVSIYMTVPRTPDGEVGFMDMAARLFQRFRGHIVFFSDDVKVSTIFPRYVPPTRQQQVVLNPSVEYLPNALGIRLTDYQRDGLLGGTGERRRVYVIPFRPPAPAAVVAEENDVDLQQALRLSEEEERLRLELVKEIPLKREWEIKLKQDEVAKVGDALCCVCLTSRASIAYVECGHQIICDGCFKACFTRTSLKHECQVCKTPVVSIIRPMYSRIQEKEEKPSPPKRRRTNKK